MKDIAGASKEIKDIIRRNIRLAEEEGRFNDDVQPVDWEGMQKVTADFVYLPKNPFKIIWSWFARGFAYVLAKPLLFFGMGSAKIIGRKNFKGIKSAIITCNHVHIFDTFFVRAAARGHKLYITVAEFNNMKGPLGVLLRGAGCIPFSDNFGAMKNLTKTISSLLQKKRYILFYPEKAMWPRYEKPRPFIEGAFHAAVTNNVPVVPTFIMFNNPKGIKKIFRRKKIGVLHVLQPVYPRTDLTKKENIEYMKNTTYEMLKKLYEENKD